MGAKRIELAGLRDTEVEQLKSFGFFAEIIAWRLRLFLPLEGETGIDALARLFLLYPPSSPLVNGPSGGRACQSAGALIQNRVPIISRAFSEQLPPSPLGCGM